jgi:hypothetical protein
MPTDLAAAFQSRSRSQIMHRGFHFAVFRLRSTKRARWVDERDKRRILGLTVRHGQAPIGPVTDVRSKSEAQAVAPKENMVSKSERVGRVLRDRDVGLVVQQSVGYVRRVADGGADDLGVWNGA